MNRLNNSIKMQRLSVLIKRNMTSIHSVQKTCQIKRYKQSESKQLEKDIFCKRNHKKAGMIILMLEKQTLKQNKKMLLEIKWDIL